MNQQQKNKKCISTSWLWDSRKDKFIENLILHLEFWLSKIQLRTNEQSKPTKKTEGQNHTNYSYVNLDSLVAI